MVRAVFQCAGVSLCLALRVRVHVAAPPTDTMGRRLLAVNSGTGAGLPAGLSQNNTPGVRGSNATQEASSPWAVLPSISSPQFGGFLNKSSSAQDQNRSIS